MKLKNIESLNELKVGDTLSQLQFGVNQKKVVEKLNNLVYLVIVSDPDCGDWYTLDYINKYDFQLEVKEEEWKPVINETYSYLNDRMEFECADWKNSPKDIMRWENGNCFKFGDGDGGKRNKIIAVLRGE